jgi:hypothetical protein
MKKSVLRRTAIGLLWFYGIQFVFGMTMNLFVNSLRLSARGWRWPSGIALFFTFGAFFNGMSFLDFNEDFSSAIMAGCWLIAVGAVIVPLVRERTRVGAVEAS